MYFNNVQIVLYYSFLGVCIIVLYRYELHKCLGKAISQCWFECIIGGDRFENNVCHNKKIEGN